MPRTEESCTVSGETQFAFMAGFLFGIVLASFIWTVLS